MKRRRRVKADNCNDHITVTLSANLRVTTNEGVFVFGSVNRTSIASDEIDLKLLDPGFVRLALLRDVTIERLVVS